MLALTSVLILVLVSLLVTRIAAAALVATGVSQAYARFQARSAFTGVGFTTSESERIVGHPQRRRVVMTLMLLGNAGIASAAATLILTFDNADAGATGIRIGVLTGGLLAIWLLASSRWVEVRLRRVLGRLLARYTDLEVRDYVGLLRVAGDYTVAELAVQDGDWVCDRTLRETRLAEEGVFVLGVDRRGSYLGTPDADLTVRADDVLVVYGRREVIADLDQRKRGIGGHLAHADRTSENEKIRRDEAVDDAESKDPVDPGSGG